MTRNSDFLFSLDQSCSTEPHPLRDAYRECQKELTQTRAALQDRDRQVLAQQHELECLLLTISALRKSAAKSDEFVTDAGDSEQYRDALSSLRDLNLVLTERISALEHNAALGMQADVVTLREEISDLILQQEAHVLQYAAMSSAALELKRAVERLTAQLDDVTSELKVCASRKDAAERDAQEARSELDRLRRQRAGM